MPVRALTAEIESAQVAPVEGAAPAAAVQAQPAPLAPGNADQELWGRVVRACGHTNPILRAILTNSTLASLDGDRAVLVCAERFAAGARKHHGAIALAFEREVGRPVTVECRAAGSEAPGPVSAGIPAVAADEGSRDAPASAMIEASASDEAVAAAVAPVEAARAAFNPNLALDHPLVRQTIEVFGAKVVDVQPRRA